MPRVTPHSMIVNEVRATGRMKPKPMWDLVSPLTASLKGWFAPKVHLARDGKTLCGKNWKDAAWGFIETIDHTPEQNGDYCARCLARVAQLQTHD